MNGKKTIAHNTRNTNTKETRNTNLGVNRNKGNNCRHPTTMTDVATLATSIAHMCCITYSCTSYKRQVRILNLESLIYTKFTTFSNLRVESEQKEETYML